MENSKKGLLPMSHGTLLCKNQCPKTTGEQVEMSTVPYASAIGSVMYGMICTRPDVSYALSICSKCQSNPGMIRWAAFENIFEVSKENQGLVPSVRR